MMNPMFVTESPKGEIVAATSPIILGLNGELAIELRLLQAILIIVNEIPRVTTICLTHSVAVIVVREARGLSREHLL